MFPAGLEPATFRVLSGRDNHYTTETGYEWKLNDAILVLALGRGLNGINRQITKTLTVNRQNRNIFTVNRQMSKPLLAVKCLRYP